MRLDFSPPGFLGQRLELGVDVAGSAHYGSSCLCMTKLTSRSSPSGDALASDDLEALSLEHRLCGEAGVGFHAHQPELPRAPLSFLQQRCSEASSRPLGRHVEQINQADGAERVHTQADEPRS